MPRRRSPPLLPDPAVFIFTGDPPLRLTPELIYQGPDLELAQRLLGPTLGNARATLRPGPAEPGRPVIKVRTSAELPAEDYRLRISDGGCAIDCSTTAGLRWALVTLSQLIAPGADSIPSGAIEDRPAFAVRGLMLDISRDKVPTMSSLLALVDHMERLKLNHLQLYTEHTFAYRGHEAVWGGCSPITKSDLDALSHACGDRGVDLAANQNCLGHLRRWLLTPGYERLAEIPSRDASWEFLTDDGRRIARQGPFSLNPTDPGSLELIADLLGQLLPLFPSVYANIGCDEAHDLGQGRSRDQARVLAPEILYTRHLESVARLVARHGKRPLFWADILLKALRDSPHDAPLLDSLHRLRELGATPLVWGYEPDTPFAAATTALNQAGFPCWVCPGTSAWLSVTGRSRVRNANFAAAAACAASSSGFLITDWGDEGHRQHWPISLHAVALGAARAWNPDATPSPAAAGRVLFTGPDAANLGAWIEELGEIGADLSARLGLRNRSALYDELHRPIPPRPLAPPTEDASLGSLSEWEAIAARLESLESRLGVMADIDPLVRAELEHTLRVARHAAGKAIILRSPRYSADGGRAATGSAALVALAADMAEIALEHRELWTRRNRPGGLDASALWYERLIDEYQRSPPPPPRSPGQP